ncbi:MarR family transcriptional regulator [Nonomuraea zeae]|uniref:MarR family transcriptional regulator n=1 Tax=Nonomuraea zeae TaxID=1642303 RepID=A0A5S4GA27_9ACTN|nr:helix-turn-helix domain-containing protein [Nonomuraea zeae]TMR29867.1 MarR family transcriptional regulator [Nonomuraea zeae]
MDHVTEQRSGWTFLTNHARVLLAIAADPMVRVRDIAANIGITERAAQGIVRDLEEAGYLRRSRVGRRNRYQIIPHRPFRHPAEGDMPVQALIDLFTHRDQPGAVAEGG